MQFANDSNGRRTHISEAEAGAKYYCPSCGAPMIQRHGQINIPHFSHSKGNLCSDSWKYEEMTEWHVSWQAFYPLDNQEVVVSNTQSMHRADVLINDTVIEFQHSPMSVEEFNERNDFYLTCGYRVVWLFDARDAYQTHLTEGIMNDTYHWKHPPKTLTGLDLYGKIQVYFHLRDHTQADGGSVIRLIWSKNGDLSYFKSAPSEHYSETEFVQLTCTDTVQRDIDISGKNDLIHRLYILKRKNGEVECCGCPISPDGYAPQIRESKRVTCNDCEFCRGEDHEPHIVRCAGRFRNHLDNVKTVLEKNRTQEGHISSFLYIAKDGTIQDAKVDFPKDPTSSIVDLAREYEAEVLIVENVRTGNKYKISRNVDTMLMKYSRIFGYYWSTKYSTFLNNSDEIYYWSRPEWIVSWFLPKTIQTNKRFPARLDEDDVKRK